MVVQTWEPLGKSFLFSLLIFFFHELCATVNFNQTIMVCCHTVAVGLSFDVCTEFTDRLVRATSICAVTQLTFCVLVIMTLILFWKAAVCIYGSLFYLHNFSLNIVAIYQNVSEYSQIVCFVIISHSWDIFFKSVFHKVTLPQMVHCCLWCSVSCPVVLAKWNCSLINVTC